MKPLAGALVALLVLAASPPPASAAGIDLIFHNSTKACAYVTVSHSRDEGKTWHVATGTLQARYVKAGANFAGSVSSSDIKVRTQAFRNDDCTGVIANVEAANWNLQATYVARTATLYDDGRGRFYILFR